MRNIIMMFAFLSSVLVMLGCSKTTESDVGSVTFRLTDAPLIANDVDGVWVKFKEIQINSNGWQSVKTFTDFTPGDVIEPADNTNGIFNLIDLQNGNSALLAENELEPGHYSHIRIILDSTYDHHLSFDTGTDESLDTTHSGPNGNFADGHIEIAGEFTIEAGITTILMLDFNANKSIVKSGSGYKLHPSIRLVTVDTTGSVTVPLTGFPADARTVGYIYAEGTYSTSERTADANGQYFTNAIAADEPDSGNLFFGYMPGGTYTVVVVTYNADGTLTDYEKQATVTVTVGQNTIAEAIAY